MNCPTKEPPDPRALRQVPIIISASSGVECKDGGHVSKLHTNHDREERPPDPGGHLEKNVASVVEQTSNGDDIPVQNSQSEANAISADPPNDDPNSVSRTFKSFFFKSKKAIWGVARYIGPGLIISVAYMDPGNYATDVSAGATYQYKLLVMILVSGIIAVFLQSLAIRLGSITGLDLAQNCRLHCPRWLNWALFVAAQAAIVATDVAEVIGTAIALNMLFKLNLVIGCLVSIADVFVILLLYNADGSMKGRRLFEMVIVFFVLGVFICFCIQLSKVHVDDVGVLFRGYLPSKALVEANGLLQACGILGATVMPHSLYLGSGLCQGRLEEWDRGHGHIASVIPMIHLSTSTSSADPPPFSTKYRPSLRAIRACMKWSILELAFALFTLALFVNSAILIVAGNYIFQSTSAQASDAANGNLFSVYTLLQQSVGKAAGTTFALALLFSGISAGIVCTMAGQLVVEGQTNFRVRPWLLRLATRSVSLIPSIVVAACYGKEGVGKALTGTQVALSVILPIVSAPLIWFTCRSKVMTVLDGETGEPVRMRNGKVMASISVLLWGVIVLMNGALIVLTALGED